MLVGVFSAIGAVAVLFYRVKKFDGDLRNISQKVDKSVGDVMKEVKNRGEEMHAIHLDLSNRITQVKSWLERDAAYQKPQGRDIGP